MKTIKSEKGINLVSFTIYLVLILGTYAIWKYGPVYWQRENLSEIVQNTMISTKKLGSDGVAKNIAELAEKNLDLKIPIENITVTYDANRAVVEIVYNVTVHHLFGYVTVHTLHLEEKRDLLD